MNAPTALSVIIPTWNGWAHLTSCLDSLRQQTYRDLEIIVVDDGSTDGTAKRLAESYPEVRCLVSTVNRGFAPTVNQGLAAARGRWIFLLNNDVTLEPQCVEKLMECARDGSFSMICPLVYWTENPTLLYSAGDAIGVSGRPYSRGFRQDGNGFPLGGSPFGVSGGYGMFRRAMLDEIGFLDESFVAYFEDADLCFRARWAGHEAALVPEAIAFHVGGASIEGRTWWRTRQCFQNHALLVFKNFPLTLLWRYRGPILRERWHQWSRVFRVARSEWGALRALGFALSAWWGLIVRIPRALTHRHRILSRRAIPVAAMQQLLEGGETYDV